MRGTAAACLLLAVAAAAVLAHAADEADVATAAVVVPDGSLDDAASPPPTLLLADDYWVASIDGDDADDADTADDAADVGSEDEAAVEAAASDAAGEAAATDASIDAALAAAATPAASTTPSFTIATTFGTVPDADGVPASAYRGVDMAVDGDAVFVALQDGGRNWRASVFRVDGGGPPRPVGGSPGFTPGPAMDLTLAVAPTSTPSAPRLAVAYREGVYHHGYYRDGDDSWVYVTPSPSGRFTQTGAAFTNARPRDLAAAFAADGAPVVAYADDEYNKRVTVRALDRTGGWPTVGDQGFSRGAVSAVKLAVGAGGALYVAYADATCDDRATVMKYTPATNWTSVGPPCLSVGKAAGLSLTLVNGTSPCIAYGDGGVGGVGVLGCAIDGAWRIIAQAPFSPTRTAATSLAYDAARRALLVAYRDGGYGGRLSVSAASAAGWTVLGRRGFSQDAVWRTRVGVTAGGAVWVAGEIGAGADETDGVVLYKL